ncbi:MAG TPA: hypothetical protein VMT76_09370 [Puia sp.]|nr:hypothetical protein [Puia sp.]
MNPSFFTKHKLALLLFSFFVLTVTTSAQTLKDVFTNSASQVLYLGIDFTKFKVIDEPTANATDIRERQYAGINDLIINEAKKYDLKSAFQRNEMDHDISFVAERNSKANIADIVSTNTADYHRLKDSDIESLVKGFSFGGKKGIGLLFVAEAMSKSEKSIAVWVTLIDMGSRKILMTERLEGKLAGFGFRNYVGGGIKSVIDQIEKKKYKEWKGKFDH